MMIRKKARDGDTRGWKVHYGRTLSSECGNSWSVASRRPPDAERWTPVARSPSRQPLLSSPLFLLIQWFVLCWRHASSVATNQKPDLDPLTHTRTLVAHTRRIDVGEPPGVENVQEDQRGRS